MKILDGKKRRIRRWKRLTVAAVFTLYPVSSSIRSVYSCAAVETGRKKNSVFEPVFHNCRHASKR